MTAQTEDFSDDVWEIVCRNKFAADHGDMVIRPARPFTVSRLKQKIDEKWEKWKHDPTYQRYMLYPATPDGMDEDEEQDWH